MKVVDEIKKHFMNFISHQEGVINSKRVIGYKNHELEADHAKLRLLRTLLNDIKYIEVHHGS